MSGNFAIDYVKPHLTPRAQVIFAGSGLKGIRDTRLRPLSVAG